MQTLSLQQADLCSDLEGVILWLVGPGNSSSPFGLEGLCCPRPWVGAHLSQHARTRAPAPSWPMEVDRWPCCFVPLGNKWIFYKQEFAEMVTSVQLAHCQDLKDQNPKAMRILDYSRKPNIMCLL